VPTDPVIGAGCSITTEAAPLSYEIVAAEYVLLSVNE
jgi:hypothetical protein